MKINQLFLFHSCVRRCLEELVNVNKKGNFGKSKNETNSLLDNKKRVIPIEKETQTVSCKADFPTKSSSSSEEVEVDENKSEVRTNTIMMKQNSSDSPNESPEVGMTKKVGVEGRKKCEKKEKSESEKEEQDLETKRKKVPKTSKKRSVSASIQDKNKQKDLAPKKEKSSKKDKKLSEVSKKETIKKNEKIIFSGFDVSKSCDKHGSVKSKSQVSKKNQKSSNNRKSDKTSISKTSKSSRKSKQSKTSSEGGKKSLKVIDKKKVRSGSKSESASSSSDESSETSSSTLSSEYSLFSCQAGNSIVSRPILKKSSDTKKQTMKLASLTKHDSCNTKLSQNNPASFSSRCSSAQPSPLSAPSTAKSILTFLASPPQTPVLSPKNKALTSCLQSPIRLKRGVQSPKKPHMECSVQSPKKPVIECCVQSPKKPVIECCVQSPMKPVIECDAQSPRKANIECGTQSPVRKKTPQCCISSLKPEFDCCVSASLQQSASPSVNQHAPLSIVDQENISIDSSPEKREDTPCEFYAKKEISPCVEVPAKNEVTIRTPIECRDGKSKEYQSIKFSSENSPIRISVEVDNKTKSPRMEDLRGRNSCEEREAALDEKELFDMHLSCANTPCDTKKKCSQEDWKQKYLALYSQNKDVQTHSPKKNVCDSPNNKLKLIEQALESKVRITRKNLDQKSLACNLISRPNAEIFEARNFPLKRFTEHIPYSSPDVIFHSQLSGHCSPPYLNTGSPKYNSSPCSQTTKNKKCQNKTCQKCFVKKLGDFLIFLYSNWTTNML